MEALAAQFSVGAGRFAIVLFPLLVLVAGMVDVMTRRIPNRIALLTAALFFPLALLSGMPAWMLAVHVLTGMAFLAFGYCLFLFGILGGGDGKMMAAAGLWLGYPCSILFAGYALLAGGVLAAAIGVWYLARRQRSFRSRSLGGLFGPAAPSVPYGLALAAGAILAMPSSWWMRIAAS